ncbi:UNKNOWN [Stylonychia lemnae]|uniref:Uncharacterized protein n=1 Tax=Stylonychia lemnae TaxID=5949 RepID=A0A078BCL8_STYLE|nr:UNKNOWN [Stylonychia lemnae]|eukprot:CDW90952.1 UNKNOWN [Stylonychia lemnae]
MEWSILNQFVDVQSSPSGEIFAIQMTFSSREGQKFYVYKFNLEKGVWNIYDDSFQVKSVRFDRLGNMFYLGPDNCIYTEYHEKLLCGQMDFEVMADGKIIAINDGKGQSQYVTSENDNFMRDEDSGVQYKSYLGVKGITLKMDKPIFLNADNKVDPQYGEICLVSISGGVDGSIWGLECEDDVQDYRIVKYQPKANKWYYVDGARGISLSTYNEISVAIINSLGLITVSSSSTTQLKPVYSDEPEDDLKNFVQQSNNGTEETLELVSKTDNEPKMGVQNASDQNNQTLRAQVSLIRKQKKITPSKQSEIQIRNKQGNQNESELIDVTNKYLIREDQEALFRHQVEQDFKNLSRCVKLQQTDRNNFRTAINNCFDKGITKVVSKNQLHSQFGFINTFQYPKTGQLQQNETAILFINLSSSPTIISGYNTEKLEWEIQKCTLQFDPI